MGVGLPAFGRTPGARIDRAVSGYCEVGTCGAAGAAGAAPPPDVSGLAGATGAAGAAPPVSGAPGAGAAPPGWAWPPFDRALNWSSMVLPAAAVAPAGAPP